MDEIDLVSSKNQERAAEAHDLGQRFDGVVKTFRGVHEYQKLSEAKWSEYRRYDGENAVAEFEVIRVS